MKKILIVAALLIGTLAWAEPHGLDVIAQTNNPHPTYQQHTTKSNLETAIDDAIQILLDQGLAGVFILCLIMWTIKESKANRSIQKEHFDKFVEISTECSGHMAAVSTKLENIEREMEQAKTLQMMKG
tara:strand:+ start:42 stop:425 length:384 start_codon:yes stop_codon:yes gene_type:complete